MLAELSGHSIYKLNRLRLISDSFLLKPADQLRPLLLLKRVAIVILGVETLNRHCEGRDLELTQLVLPLNAANQLVTTLS